MEAMLLTIIVFLAIIAAILRRVERHVRPETYVLMRWNDKKWTWTGRGAFEPAYFTEEGQAYISEPAAWEAAKRLHENIGGTIHIFEKKRGAVIGYVSDTQRQAEEQKVEQVADSGYVLVSGEHRFPLSGNRPIHLRLETIFSRVVWRVEERRDQRLIILEVREATTFGDSTHATIAGSCIAVIDGASLRYLPLETISVESVPDFKQGWASLEKTIPAGFDAPTLGFLHIRHFSFKEHDEEETKSRPSDALSCTLVLKPEQFATLLHACEARRVGQVDVDAMGAGLTTSSSWELAGDLVLPHEGEAWLHLHDFSVTELGPSSVLPVSSHHHQADE